ncbi:MAG: hypothetical protein H6744_19385 [Deltaproteobacteria bacterium]|nr:hypothetical protein [Deltaproteobacteria bacterium]MCB9788844.1 hypothetical protein [Deltaproteobacteria bacterium]
MTAFGSAWGATGPGPLVWLIALALVLALVAGALGGLWLARRRVARAVERSRALGTRGESEAERLLIEAGYAVVRRQASEALAMLVDGEAHPASVRVDFLVSRDGRLYAAEAKGGLAASEPTWSPTRRQLLEYTVAFDVDGVLLVDAARGRIHHIRFPDLE